MSEKISEHLLNQCLFFTTSKLDRLLTRWADEAFAENGLAPNYAFTILIINDNPGLPISELAKMLHLTPSTLTRFIDKLEGKGWLTRQQEGRQTFINPTEKSLAQHQGILSSWNGFWKKYTAILGINDGNGLANQILKAYEQLEVSESKT